MVLGDFPGGVGMPCMGSFWSCVRLAQVLAVNWHNSLFHASTYPAVIGYLTAGDPVPWLASSWYMCLSDKSRKETPGDVFMCVRHPLLLSESFGCLVRGRGDTITAFNPMGWGSLTILFMY